MKKEYRVWFFFSFYHIGGAEKVHLQIAQATGGKDCVIWFTRKSHNDLFLQAFRDSGCDIKEISGFTSPKWLYFMNLIWRGVISGYINSQKQQPVVFNGQNNFGYKLAPWIKKTIPQVELIHSLNTFSYIRIPFLPFITRTVMISRKRIEDHVLLYEKLSIPAAFAERIQYISNAIPLPSGSPKKENELLTVLFVGRGGLEKRVYLIAEMAKQLYARNGGFQFEFLGDVSDVLNTAEYRYIRFYGNQSDQKFIRHIYDKAHVLILTSETEGFPMVVIEAMAHGAAIISTPVGDIPYHIKNDINGYLFSSVIDEEKIIQEGIEYLLKLKKDHQLLNKIGENNIKHARECFTIEKFNNAYRHLLETVKVPN